MKPKILKRRIISLAVAVVMVFSLYGFRLMDIQAVNGDYYEQRTQTVYTRTQRIKAARGEIMDRYGKSMAVNINGYDVVFNKAFLDESSINEMILRLAGILLEADEEWVDNLPITETAPFEFKEGRAGEIKALVSTVVIEVGINVPNATVMVIENSERFGLAQLHQLRGRVGRGSDQSYCFLISKNESGVAKERNEIMCRTNDGFEIAEADLQLRGPGEIFGTRQHGLPELHISDLVRHGDVLEKAKDAARDIMAADPRLEKPEHAVLKSRIKKMFGDEIRLEL